LPSIGAPDISDALFTNHSVLHLRLDVPAPAMEILRGYAFRREARAEVLCTVREGANVWTNVAIQLNFSLAINSKLMRDFEGRAEPSPFPPTVVSWGRKLGEIKEPGRTALFLDNGIPGEERLCRFQLAYTGQPKAFASQFPGRYDGAGNILFVAGHVLTMAGKDVVEMDPASVFRGRAIFPPTELVWCHDPALVP